MDDHRWDPRVSVSLPLELVRGERVVTAIARNLSFGGLYVETCEPLRTFSFVHLRFRLPIGRTIDVHGVVAHSQIDGAGMHFFGLAGRDRPRGTRGSPPTTYAIVSSPPARLESVD